MDSSQIFEAVSRARTENIAAINMLQGECSLDRYAHLMRADADGSGEIWTDAFQAALDENRIVRIPAREIPYLIDRPIIVPSHRRIIADGAAIRLADGVDTLMLRNEHTHDGTHRPIDTGDRDVDISICGGTWMDNCTARAGYGRTGKYDAARSFYGVSTLMLFNNVRGLTVEHAAFAHCGAFAVQCGDSENIVFEDITFKDCYADGLHTNGGITNMLIRGVRGQVGDDLVALNMYDWQNSSVNFGPTRNVWCEDLELAADSRYKAIRIEPGMYRYADSSIVDCALNNAMFKNVRGIRTFKLYYQTPAYPIGGEAEWGDVGSADNIYFEDIAIDLQEPIDRLPDYMNSDAVTGAFAGFELNAKIKQLHFKDIRLTVDKQRWPQAYLVCVGPKSCRHNGKEIFDPGLSGEVQRLELEGISVNGQEVHDISQYVREIVFDHLYPEAPSFARGTIHALVCK